MLVGALIVIILMQSLALLVLLPIALDEKDIPKVQTPEYAIPVLKPETKKIRAGVPVRSMTQIRNETENTWAKEVGQ
jgi:hypothetical protein